MSTPKWPQSLQELVTFEDYKAYSNLVVDYFMDLLFKPVEIPFLEEPAQEKEPAQEEVVSTTIQMSFLPSSDYFLPEEDIDFYEDKTDQVTVESDGFYFVR